MINNQSNEPRASQVVTFFLCGDLNYRLYIIDYIFLYCKTPSPGMLNKEAQLDSSPIWNMPKIEYNTYSHMAIKPHVYL